ASAVAIELEALCLSSAGQPIEMLLEVGDALVRIELHTFFEIGRRWHRRHASPQAGSCASPLGLRIATAVPTPRPWRPEISSCSRGFLRCYRPRFTRNRST